jgi:hypothetical protein
MIADIKRKAKIDNFADMTEVVQQEGKDKNHGRDHMMDGLNATLMQVLLVMKGLVLGERFSEITKETLYVRRGGGTINYC